VSKADEPDRHCGPAAVAALFAHRPADVLCFFYTPMRRQEAGVYCAALANAFASLEQTLARYA